MIRLLAALLVAATAQCPPQARAWGDEGHQIIALIAEALLRPEVRRQVHAMLALDDDPLTDHDIADEATWADHLRSADPDGARRRTRQWHFVDIELRAPSLDAACFGHPKLPPGTFASLGPAQACLVDKIDQFAAELANPATPPDERLLALKFLLHFIGDIHQPLHTADDDDRGGNDKAVSAPGFRAANLHHFWDAELIRSLGDDPKQIASALLHRISPAIIQRFAAGTPADWARESHQLAVRHAYGLLPAPTRQGSYRLTDLYIQTAIGDCREQLRKAAIRLAQTLNRTLAPLPNRQEGRGGGAPRVRPQ